MPSHTGWAKPVSPSPAPHGQRTAESIAVNNKHRTVLGGAGRMSHPFDRQQAPASVADSDCSRNRERDAGRQCRQRHVCGLTPAMLQHNQMTVTLDANPAGEIQPDPVRACHNTLENITHMTEGQSRRTSPHQRQGPSDQTPLQPQRLRGQSFAVEHYTSRGGLLRHGRPLFAFNFIQKRGVSRENVGSARQSFDDPRIQGTQDRQDFLANPIPPVYRLPIGGIGTVCHPTGCEIVQDLLPRHAQQRPHDFPFPLHRNTGQTARSGSPHQPQENGFRLVISGMAGRYGCHLLLPQHSCEKRIARVPRPTLKRPAELRHEMRPLTVHRHSQPHSQFPDEDLVRFRLVSTQTVIDMGDAQLDPRQKSPFAHLMQGRQEADGIRPSGNGNQHPVAWLKQFLAPDGVRDLPEDWMKGVTPRRSHTPDHDDMDLAGRLESLRKISRA